MNDLDIDISLANKNWQAALPAIEEIAEKAVRKAFEVAEKSERLKEQKRIEISLRFSDDLEVRQLNRQYRNKDKPTNVLSFPQASADIRRPEAGQPFFLGDIILAYETVENEAKMAEISLESHTIHLVVHGLLHLLGYDHENDKDARLMENTETEILEMLGQSDPYSRA